MTVGDMVDKLATVDRSWRVFTIDARGNPCEVMLMADVTPVAMTETGTEVIPGVALLALEHLRMLDAADKEKA